MKTKDATPKFLVPLLSLAAILSPSESLISGAIRVGANSDPSSLSFSNSNGFYTVKHEQIEGAINSSSKKNLGNLKLGDTFSGNYRPAIDYLPGINKYSNYKVKKIEVYQGPYINFFGSYYQKEAIQSGAINISASNCVISGVSTIYKVESSFSIGAEMATKLAVQADIGVFSGLVEFSASIGMNYYEGTTTTYVSSYTTQTVIQYNLGTAAAEFCPDGAEISIGQYGRYYVITFEETIYIDWLWEDQFLEERENKIVISKSGDLATGFIYRGIVVPHSPSC